MDVDKIIFGLGCLILGLLGFTNRESRKITGLSSAGFVYSSYVLIGLGIISILYGLLSD